MSFRLFATPMLLLVLLSPGAYSQDFEIYVSDGATPSSPSDWKILRYDSQGQSPEVFIDDRLAWPQDVLFLEAEQEVLVSNLNSGRITRYDAESGEYINDFATGLRGPTRMRFGPDGKIYVLQWNFGPVLRFERDGTPLGGFTDSGIQRAIGLDWDASGRMYVASYNQDQVVRFDALGNTLGVFASEGLSGPTDVWFDDQGNLLVLNFDSNSVSRFSPSGQSLGAFISSIGRPEGLAELPSGNILIGEGASGSLREYTQSGQLVGVRVNAGSGGLVRPNAITLRSPESAQSGFTPNAGLNDAWYNPDTSGQGFFINVLPEVELLFLGWFTFDADPQAGGNEAAIVGAASQRWLTALGGWEGSVATLDVANTRGGVFDDDEPVEISEPGTYGSITIDFHDCSTATLNYDLASDDLAGEMQIQRISDDNVALCEALRPE